MAVIATPARRRRPGDDEGDQRHRHDAAARRLPEGAERAQAGGEVVDRGLRLVAARPGDVHRGHRAARAAPQPATPRTPSRSRATCAGFARRRPDVASRCCGSPTSSARRCDTPLTATSRCRSCRRCSASTRGCSSCTRTTASRCCGARTLERPPGHVQRRRRRRAAALPGDPPRRPAVAARCRARGARGSARSLRRLGVADFSPEQIRFLTYGRVVDTTPDARGARLHPALHDPRGVRRLRRRQRLHGPLSRGRRRPSSGALRRRAGRSASRAASMPDARVIPIGGDDRAEPAPRRDAVAAGASRASASGPRAARRCSTGTPPRPRSPRRRDRPTRRRTSPRRHRCRAAVGRARRAGADATAAPGLPRVGAQGRRRRWRSCAAGSPATTRSTSSASTPSSPTRCCSRCCARSTSS